jgi:hypothetical protein
MRIYLNPRYAIRNEKGCSYIITIETQLSEEISQPDGSITAIPPVIGYILSHIGEDELVVSEKLISEAIYVQSITIDKFIKALLDNPRSMALNYNGYILKFPPYLLTSIREKACPRIFTTNDFNQGENFVPKRPSAFLN